MLSDKLLLERFHCEMIDFIKKYQFRDRNVMSSCGLTIGQCYIMETLNRNGPLTMKKLAEKMHLSISTITRTLDPLVDQKLISREPSSLDQRVRIIQLTNSGSEVFKNSWKRIMDCENTIIESFPEEQREILVSFLQKLNSAFGSWNSRNCK
ncbi:MAG: MarR family transcriptional regulator [Ignavibacteria bacterium]|jgi:DNA-binding MarR family transcriptional regulator